jgi:hypothetical protein
MRGQRSRMSLRSSGLRSPGHLIQSSNSDEDTRQHPCGTRCPSFAGCFTLMKERAQGKPGARCTRGLVCKRAQKHAHEHTGPAEAIRLSLRSGLRLIPRSPRCPGLIATVARGLASANLIPASGDQDHASSPSAMSGVRLSPSSRPPHPTARFVTCATPLSSGETGQADSADLPDRLKRNIFAARAGQTFGDLPVALLCRGRDNRIRLAREAKQQAVARMSAAICGSTNKPGYRSAHPGYACPIHSARSRHGCKVQCPEAAPDGDESTNTSGKPLIVGCLPSETALVGVL